MILSGWKIYNASPIFDFVFPKWITLGGWLGGALSLHFAMMWLLVANGITYIVYSLCTGHLRNDIFGFRPDSIYRKDGISFRTLLIHGIDEYNLVQRILYTLVILDLIVLVFSGLAIWKPAQFDELTVVLGGYDFARIIHFYAMSGLVIFIIVHVLAGLSVKGAILSMITGHYDLKSDEKS
jgi:thiosulfate reductase cytochrome b subunit